MKTMRRLAVIGAVAALLAPGGARAQVGLTPEQACTNGVLEGTLGISGLDCVGECTHYIREGEGENRWVFSTEPRIFSIQEEGPSYGLLRAGDFLVAIDGHLITSREGGLRFANLVPGETVSVRYRRGGSIRSAAIRVGAECRRPAEPAAIVGRARPVPPARPVAAPAPPTVGIATAPRVRVVPGVGEGEVVGRALSGALATGTLLGLRPRAFLGIGFSCSMCGTQTDGETGLNIWSFSEPPEVTQVNQDGPAHEAGIRIGDLIKAVDGKDITTDEGGTAWSELEPGEAVRITLVRRNGREETVRLVPGEPRSTLAADRSAVASDAPPAVGIGVRPARPDTPPRADLPENPKVPSLLEATDPLAGVLAGPEDLPLSYSGTVEGVEVVVRGGPVSVSRIRGTQVLLIRAEGLWVRIRVPAGNRR